jgi:hypothetical protein
MHFAFHGKQIDKYTTCSMTYSTHPIDNGVMHIRVSQTWDSISRQ